MARESSRVFRIFAVELIIWIKNCFPGCVGKCGPDSFCPHWPFSRRFPGLSVPGGITYRFCRKTPLNRKSRKNKVVRDFRTTKDDYLMAGNKTLKNYENIFGN